MARVTHVKAAQQRYETVPVLDADGKPVKIALTKADGSPKTTKAKGSRPARPVFITKTMADKSKPLPNRNCGKCGVEIKPGDPYKWIKPKSGPYGGRLMVRCGSCPTWQVWDYSSSLSAQTARISHDFQAAISGAESPDDVTAALEQAASEVREIAEQKRESAQNIEDGFQHATYQSDELNETADALDAWADEIESADVPDLPEPEDTDCGECGGTGETDNPDWDEDAAAGTQEAADEPSDEQMDEWRDEVQDAVSIVDECPV